ncbi:Hypothetical_protein [Hexamita inflata]|uniref:Hypothetical_protein n=1 Tax=Hexamita inflata TaxID=28002 RepID=A0AA86P9N7_9EUKA|nr:Hypothetical protein HINF_LOCUS22371 [Hexamita inflata]
MKYFCRIQYTSRHCSLYFFWQLRIGLNFRPLLRTKLSGAENGLLTFVSAYLNLTCFSYSVSILFWQNLLMKQSVVLWIESGLSARIMNVDMNCIMICITNFIFFFSSVTGFGSFLVYVGAFSALLLNFFLMNWSNKFCSCNSCFYFLVIYLVFYSLCFYC